MEAFVGSIMLFGGNFNPRGWALCQGQSMSVSQNTALYAILGNTFGGNQTNFNLPDLRGKVPVGAGGNYQNGQTGGSASSPVSGSGIASGSFTLTTAQLPAHTHTATAIIGMPALADDGNSNQPGSTAILASANNGNNIYSTNPGSADTTLAPFNSPVTVDSTGGGQPVPLNLSLQLNGASVATMPPFVAMNYIMCLYGIFPSRD